MENTPSPENRLRRWTKWIVIRAFVAYLAIGATLFFFQEYVIFPPLLLQALGYSFVQEPPDVVSVVKVSTSDGAILEGWTTYSPERFPHPSHVAIIFHGNGETIHAGNFLPFFLQHGVPAYSFDYRGYGNSTGWPSEELLQSDARQIWEFIKKETGVPNTGLIVLGNSLGTGIAASLADDVSPKALFLLAAYTSMRDVVNYHPVYRWFSWALRYDLPTATHLAKLRASFLVLAHGEKDDVIPFYHLEGNINAARLGQTSSVIPLRSKIAGHNNLFYAVEQELNSEVEKILKEPNPPST
jgi:uncharacterized protein